MLIEEFQRLVTEWGRDCFGDSINTNRKERAYRFIEEALELAQACGLTEDEIKTQLAYTFNRPKDTIVKESGQTLGTLALLCSAHEISLNDVGVDALNYCREHTDRIRVKWESKEQRTPGGVLP